MSFITTIREDIKTVQSHDPAAQSALVIFLSYPFKGKRQDIFL